MYQNAAKRPKLSATTLEPTKRMREPDSIERRAITNAWGGVSLAEGIGLPFVLFIKESISLSWY